MIANTYMHLKVITSTKECTKSTFLKVNEHHYKYELSAKYYGVEQKLKLP